MHVICEGVEKTHRDRRNQSLRHSIEQSGLVTLNNSTHALLASGDAIMASVQIVFVESREYVDK